MAQRLVTLVDTDVNLANHLRAELSRWGVKYQKGVAPDGVLEAYAADPKKFLAGLRA